MDESFHWSLLLILRLMRVQHASLSSRPILARPKSSVNTAQSRHRSFLFAGSTVWNGGNKQARPRFVLVFQFHPTDWLASSPAIKVNSRQRQFTGRRLGADSTLS